MNKQSEYIVVKTKSNKKAKAVKDNNAMDTDKPEESWPSSLSDYVANAFAHCQPDKSSALENQLKKIIQQAQRTNILKVIDWNERDLPNVCTVQQNPNSAKLSRKLPKNQNQKQIQMTKRPTQTATQPLKQQKSKSSPQTLSSKMGGIALTSKELKMRELRALRFQQDNKKPSTPAPPAPAPLLKKGAKKKQSLYTPIVWETETSLPSHDVIVGTSTELEKPYFRLTSAADPATVRPLPILKEAFKFLLRKWENESNYTYICEQFKSMRQDLTVQRIRNEFTVQVYEAHARIALAKGDLGEYNQCQTQLKYLYEQNITGCEDEFLAYRILYMLFSQNESEINAMLEDMTLVGLDKQALCVQHALMVRSALAKGNYYQFFALYKKAPNMGRYLMDQFVDRTRIDALIVICKAYLMGISLKVVAQQLLMAKKKLIQFLRGHGLEVNKKTVRLDTKAALPILVARKANYNKVDIKGQI